MMHVNLVKHTVRHTKWQLSQLCFCDMQNLFIYLTNYIIK